MREGFLGQALESLEMNKKWGSKECAVWGKGRSK